MPPRFGFPLDDLTEYISMDDTLRGWFSQDGTDETYDVTNEWRRLFRPIPYSPRQFEPSMEIGDILVIGSKPSSVFSSSMACYLNNVVSILRVANRDNFKFTSLTNPTDDWIRMFNFDNKCIDKTKSYFLQQLLS